MKVRGRGEITATRKKRRSRRMKKKEMKLRE